MKEALMKNEKDEAMKIAKLLATCPSSRLPLVIDFLKQSGFDVDSSIVEADKKSALTSKTERRKKSRQRTGHSDWYSSDDKTVRALRYAYEKGVSFTDVSRKGGTCRTQLYKYLAGVDIPAPATGELIRIAIAQLCDLPSDLA
jgi:ribosomal protein L21